MVLSRQLPVGFADLLHGSAARHLQGFVIIVLRVHGGSRRRAVLLFLLIVDIDKLGIDDVLFGFLARGAIRAGRAALRWGSSRLAGGFVHCLRQLVASRGQLVGGGVQFRGVALGDGLAGLFDGDFDFLGFSVADLAAVLLQGLLGTIDHVVGAIAGFDLFLLLAI